MRKEKKKSLHRKGEAMWRASAEKCGIGVCESGGKAVPYATTVWSVVSISQALALKGYSDTRMYPVSCITYHL